jgi:uncharacterized membrane protein
MNTISKMKSIIHDIHCILYIIFILSVWIVLIFCFAEGMCMFPWFTLFVYFFLINAFISGKINFSWIAPAVMKKN